MKKILSIALSFALIGGLSVSCVGDLNVTPIDPNLELPEDVLNSEAAYTSLLAKCYQGLAVSSSDGPSGGPDIDGVDGGYGQYLRALVNMQELTTDVMTCCWNDAGLPDLHNFTWTTSNGFVFCMYYRVFYQIGLCNEFIRRSNEAVIAEYPNKNAYIAEARALRLLSYYHAIDMFGNVPFFTEENTVGSTGPQQISRADLFSWMETEALDILAGNDLAAPGKNVYGRCDKGLVQMVLAKLYLNAEVWKGEAMYDKCADVCEDLISEYRLASKYADLFCADNHLRTANTTYNGDEIIFSVNQDGELIQSYGATNFLIFASLNDETTPDKYGISGPWGGLSLTGAFTKKFEEKDARAMFIKVLTKDGAETALTQNITNLFDHNKGGGYKSGKFTNVNHDGSAAKAAGFVDTDFPVFRVADAYLMYAECAVRGAADKSKGQEYFDAVRARAGLDSKTLTLNEIIDERGRELYLEGFRRQDLVRFGLFTSADYLWDFKGGVEGGKGVSEHLNLFPLMSADVNANANLTQNEGY